jgi:hypothetical protein
MINLIAIVIAGLGLFMFLRGFRQHRNPDIMNIPMISPVGKQIMGGASFIAGLVIFIMSFRKHYDIPSNSSQRRNRF